MRRDCGLSLKQIERLLGVSRSSVSLWVRDIELTAVQREALIHNAQTTRDTKRTEYFRANRRGYQDGGRAVARRGDPFHAAGCMLYWAEGRKGRNSVALCNSDPEILRFFLLFLRTYFRVPDEKIRVWCNLFADHLERQREVEQFWLDLLDLPRECLTKSTVNVFSKYSQRKRINKLPYGTWSRRGTRHGHPPAHLWRHPGVRRLRTSRVAGLARPDFLGSGGRRCRLGRVGSPVLRVRQERRQGGSSI